MAELDYNFSPYNFCLNNPVNLLDRNGLSTHTDSLGNIIAVYDDNDNSVYRHDELPEEYATYEGQTKTITDKEGNKTEVEIARLSGGVKMGETEYWDEFRSHDNETGAVLNDVEGRIMFGESWESDLWDLRLQAQGMDLIELANSSQSKGLFDIKSNATYASYGPGTGKLLDGKYASARSAGNYLAGWNAKYSNIAGNYISLTTFMKLAGALHTGNWSKANAAKVVLFGTSYGPAPYYGEIPYAGRMIRAGWNTR